MKDYLEIYFNVLRKSRYQCDVNNDTPDEKIVLKEFVAICKRLAAVKLQITTV